MCVKIVLGYKYLSSCRHRQAERNRWPFSIVCWHMCVSHTRSLNRRVEWEWKSLNIPHVHICILSVDTLNMHVLSSLALPLSHFLTYYFSPIRLSRKFSFIFNFPLSHLVSQSFSQCALTICKHVMQCKYLSPSQSSLFIWDNCFSFKSYKCCKHVCNDFNIKLVINGSNFLTKILSNYLKKLKEMGKKKFKLSHISTCSSSSLYVLSNI